MSAGPQVEKFTCLVPSAEVKGIIVGTPDPNHIDLMLDDNYAHMKFPFPGPPYFHMESYGTDDAGGCEPNPAYPHALPTVVDVDGNRRPIREGDHIRVIGSWVTDNDLHPDERNENNTFQVGPLRLWVDYNKTELHPYFLDSMMLVPSRKSSDSLMETLSLAAPYFTAAYRSIGHTKIVGYGGRVFTNNIHYEATAEWDLSLPHPAGSTPDITHRFMMTAHRDLWPSEEGDVITYEESRTPYNYHISVKIKGGDVLSPNKLKVRYEVWWKELLRVLITPNEIPAGVDTPVRVDIFDTVNSANVIGDIVIDGSIVGQTGQDFRHTFVSDPTVGEVRAPNYPAIPLSFNVVLRDLRLQVSPDPPPHDTSVQMAVGAQDAQTAQVITNAVVAVNDVNVGVTPIKFIYEFKQPNFYRITVDKPAYNTASYTVGTEGDCGALDEKIQNSEMEIEELQAELPGASTQRKQEITAEIAQLKSAMRNAIDEKKAKGCYPYGRE